MDELMEKLSAAVFALEAAAQHLSTSTQERVAAITAEVATEREAELEARLEAAEATIAELRAAGQRKTVAVSAAAGDRVDAGALDAAMASLSIEQRFAVKAEMLRAGLLR